MKKDQTIIGFLLIAVALYFGLKSIDFKIEVKNELPSQGIQEKLIEKLIQEKFQSYQDFGYYNGLAMAKRILGENELFKEMGLDYDKDLTCEKVIEDLYKIGQEYENSPN